MSKDAAEKSQKQIESEITSLRARFEVSRQQYQEAERQGREIMQQIMVLQKMCLHLETVTTPECDGPDIKFREICKACGAQC